MTLLPITQYQHPLRPHRKKKNNNILLYYYFVGRPKVKI